MLGLELIANISPVFTSDITTALGFSSLSTVSSTILWISLSIVNLICLSSSSLSTVFIVPFNIHNIIDENYTYECSGSITIGNNNEVLNCNKLVYQFLHHIHQVNHLILYLFLL